MAQMTLIVLDAEGWGTIVNNNFQKINNQIDSLLDSSKTVHATATTVIANLGDSVAAPAAVTAIGTTSTTVSGTGDDATINANFGALDTFTAAAVVDLGNLRNTMIANQTILTNLINKVNSLLDELREGSGIAILKA
jgi:hypothetical protein